MCSWGDPYNETGDRNVSELSSLGGQSSHELMPEATTKRGPSLVSHGIKL